MPRLTVETLHFAAIGKSAAEMLGTDDPAEAVRRLEAALRHAAIYRSYQVPIGNLADGQYFQLLGGSERSAGQRGVAVGQDVEVCLPSGKTETWSSAAPVKPDPAPNWNAQPKQGAQRGQAIEAAPLAAEEAF